MFHGALHWSIPYHLDSGWARLVERTAFLMLDNTGFRDRVHLHSGPGVVSYCLEVVHLAHTSRFWLRSNGDIFLIVLSEVGKQDGISSGSHPV